MIGPEKGGAVRLEHFELSPHSETLVAVVLGATLATVSGMLATQVEAHLKRRERQRDAALLLGELLSTLHILLHQAARTRGFGDPYGPITVRMLRAARREIDLYDRNRELLYDLKNAPLRRTVHGLVVQIAMPLDGVLDASDALSAGASDPAFDPLRTARDQGFDFLIGLSEEILPVLERLGRLAHHRFEPYKPPPQTDAI
jgi:hypothetical protein